MMGYYKKPEANRTSFRTSCIRTAAATTFIEQLEDTFRCSGENISERVVEAVLAALEDAMAVGVREPAHGEE
jgi:hypothetical protein